MGRQLKRVAMPRSWPVARKTHIYTVGVNAGPYSKDMGIPLMVFIKDVLKITGNSREAKRIINEGNITVNGAVRKDYKFMIGLFDIVSISAIGKNYRIIFDKNGRIKPLEITDIDKRLCRINNKVYLKGGRIQLNLHDGSNILADKPDYGTFDSIVLSLPDKKISEHFVYKPGSLAMIIGGQHSGEIGTIKEIKKVRGSGTNMVAISAAAEFETVEKYVFVIGDTKPAIQIGD